MHLLVGLLKFNGAYEVGRKGFNIKNVYKLCK